MIPQSDGVLSQGILDGLYLATEVVIFVNKIVCYITNSEVNRSKQIMFSFLLLLFVFCFCFFKNKKKYIIINNKKIIIMLILVWYILIAEVVMFVNKIVCYITNSEVNRSKQKTFFVCFLKQDKKLNNNNNNNNVNISLVYFNCRSCYFCQQNSLLYH